MNKREKEGRFCLGVQYNCIRDGVLWTSKEAPGFQEVKLQEGD